MTLATTQGQALSNVAQHSGGTGVGWSRQLLCVDVCASDPEACDSRASVPQRNERHTEPERNQSVEHQRSKIKSVNAPKVIFRFEGWLEGRPSVDRQHAVLQTVRDSKRKDQTSRPSSRTAKKEQPDKPQ
eukprot:6023828-Amphidinium_carterae.2